MLTYLPDNLSPRPALLVVLHGSMQAAANYDRGAGWSTLADRYGFALLMPEQSGRNNLNRSFNWLELSERKAYTSALVGLRTADLSPLVQPGQDLFPLMGLSGGRFCSMGGGAPLNSEGQLVAGVGVSGGTVEQDVNILESALREAVRPALTATS
jgi:hypothetical protein